MSITRVNEFQSAGNKSAELFDFLKSLIPYISSSAGNVSVEVLKNSEQEDRFLVIEKWESVEAHRKSIESFPKEDMHAAMALFGAPPKGNYYSN